MLNVRDRALSIVELLSRHPDGLGMSDIADRLQIPRSATHRLLNDLKETGYVRQDGEGGRYLLTVKLVSLALAYLSASGMNDIVQPLLDRLAASTGELVRLAVVQGEQLVWVGKAQGARTGLRYDPDAGQQVYLPAAANGLAWLACVSEERAMQLIARQGLERAKEMGPAAPHSLQALMAQIRQTRERGYGMVVDAYEKGTSAVAAAILRPGSREPIGTVSIAGPSVRLTQERLQALAPQVLACAQELAVASMGSPLFGGAAPGAAERAP